MGLYWASPFFSCGDRRRLCAFFCRARARYACKYRQARLCEPYGCAMVFLLGQGRKSAQAQTKRPKDVLEGEKKGASKGAAWGKKERAQTAAQASGTREKERRISWDRHIVVCPFSRTFCNPNTAPPARKRNRHREEKERRDNPDDGVRQRQEKRRLEGEGREAGSRLYRKRTRKTTGRQAGKRGQERKTC